MIAFLGYAFWAVLVSVVSWFPEGPRRDRVLIQFAVRSMACMAEILGWVRVGDLFAEGFTTKAGAPPVGYVEELNRWLGKVGSPILFACDERRGLHVDFTRAS